MTSPSNPAVMSSTIAAFFATPPANTSGPCRAHSPQRAERALGDRLVQAARYGGSILAPVHEPGHLGLGEHGAHAGDRDAALGTDGLRGHLFELEAKRTRHDLKELAGPGRALVVHLEIEHPTMVPKSDHLGVLAADVQHTRGFGGQRVSAHRVRLDLGHDLAAERLARGVTPVPGCDELGVRAALNEAASDRLRVEARIRHDRVDDATVLEPHGIDAAGSYVESEYRHATTSRFMPSSIEAPLPRRPLLTPESGCRAGSTASPGTPRRASRAGLRPPSSSRSRCAGPGSPRP